MVVFTNVFLNGVHLILDIYGVVGCTLIPGSTDHLLIQKTDRRDFTSHAAESTST